jgi:hypothetical protein
MLYIYFISSADPVPRKQPKREQLMKLSNALFTALIAVTLGLLCHRAEAVQITGNIQFNGNADLNSDALISATRVDAYTDVQVSSRSGSLTSVAVGAPVTMFAPWTFNSGPIANFWSVGGFRLDLISSSVSQQSSSLLFVTGTGTLFGTNFDATPAVYSFTITSADGSTPGGIYGFSASTSSRPAGVPDGGSALVFSASRSAASS